jgi:hypothetical protein
VDRKRWGWKLLDPDRFASRQIATDQLPLCRLRIGAQQIIAILPKDWRSIAFSWQIDRPGNLIWPPWHGDATLG